MGNEHSLSHQPTNPHEADQDRDSLTMDTQSTAAVSTTFDAENGESSEERRDLRIVNGGNETTFLPTSLNDEERTDLRTPASDEASIVLESSNGEPNFSHSCEQGGNEKMAEESEKLSVQTRFVVQPDVDAISSTIEVGQAEGMVSSGLKSVDSVPEKGQTKTSEKSHASSVNGQYLQPFDPAIGLLEKNLIELINDHGGRLAVSSWTHAYEQKFGGKTLRKQLTAAGTEKLKQLLPKFQTVTRGDGREESLFLFNRRKKDQRDGSVAPLIALENKLLLVIQGRKGSATMKQLKSDFSDHFGPRALDKALKDSGCSSLEGAIKHMTRISSIKKNKKVVYTCLMTNPEQEVNIPQNGIVQQTDSPSDQQQSAVSFIDSDKKLEIWDETFLQQFLLNESKLIDSGTPDTVALSCRGGSERLYLICLAFSPNDIFVFDSVKLDAKAICEKLGPIFESTKITKLVHDLRYDTAALRTFGSVAIFRGMMDTQLIVEHMRTDFHCSFCDMLDCLQLIVPTSLRLKLRSTPKAEVYLRRPISSDLVSPIFGSLKVLVQSISKIRGNFDSKTWKALGEASDIRASASFTGTRNDPSRRVAFDVSCGYRMVSYELLSMIHPENMMKEQPLEIVQDISTLLNILPDDVQEALSQLDTTHLADIVFDQGRRPHVWIKGKRVMLFGADRLVESKEIESIAERFRFGSDNRAGLERQLHRISAIRNRESSIIGMTVRIGRHVSGNAGMIADLLFDRAGASILFLGEPGSGKTTIVREVTRILAEETNVCIVDTSNEIAGDGDVPHPCVGLARRLMVPTLDKQSAVMVEAVQNHTPSVMVIDEIGRKTEVEAAQTCKNRGVRLIASAHGDLRKLVKNQKIRGVIGGIESITLGDLEAKKEGKKHGEEMTKVKTQRAGAPIFEIVIELERGSYDSWRVVTDSAKAVDCILERQHYEAQRRTREPDTGAIHLTFENA